MAYYVNLPVSWLAQDSRWLDLFSQRRLNPELGLDEDSLALPRSFHQQTATRLRAENLRCSVHLPFFGPPPGSPDSAARQEAQDILSRAAELASIYEADHMIGHPACVESVGRAADRAGSALSQPWLERSALVWLAVHKVYPAPLFLENIHDDSPAHLCALVELLPPACGLCFDVGHWFSFAGGRHKKNLSQWLKDIAPRLCHLHLHDNNGEQDEHLGLGQGGVPWDDLFALLKKLPGVPGVTFEPHDEKALEQTLGWFKEYPEVARFMKL